MKCKACNAEYKEFWRVPEDGCDAILEDLCVKCRQWAFCCYMDEANEPDSALTGDWANHETTDET